MSGIWAFTRPEKIDMLETAAAATTLRFMNDLRVIPSFIRSLSCDSLTT
jgi:hypothetical protein